MTRVDRRFLRASAQVVVKCLLWVESGLWRVGSGQGNEARQVILCKAAVRVLGAVGSRRHANQGLLVAHSAVGIGDSPLARCDSNHPSVRSLQPAIAGWN
jgi:hypothetical protein